MREKERLLSFDEPVCFIFAHSALKEGWDNPNVFQICTLNQTVSEIKKRQEIGRGLRLAVNQTGERVFDEDVNVLTVVANESYQYYAAAPAEGVRGRRRRAAACAHQRPPQGSDPQRPYLLPQRTLPGFWEKLNRRLRYRCTSTHPTLIDECVVPSQPRRRFPAMCWWSRRAASWSALQSARSSVSAPARRR